MNFNNEDSIMKQLILPLIVVALVLLGCESPPNNNVNVQPVVQNPALAPVETVGEGGELGEDSGAWPFDVEEKLPLEMRNLPLAENQLARNFLVVFDGSRSMAGIECSDGKRKIDAAKEAVVEWGKSLPDDANVGLIAFHGGGWEMLPIVEDDDRSVFFATVNGLTANHGTPLSDAFKNAYLLLTSQALRQLSYGEYTIVAVTDGAASDSRLLARWVDFIYETTLININTIGFCIGEDHTLNQPDKTMYTAANNLEQLRAGLKEVSAESETFDVTDFVE
jgi:hypothetical protein